VFRSRFGAVTAGLFAQRYDVRAFALAAPMENPLFPASRGVAHIPLGFLVAREDNLIPSWATASSATTSPRPSRA
jgi:hypothetical protein